MAHPNIDGLCEFLVSQLDAGRQRWLDIGKEFLVEEHVISMREIVNQRLDPTIDVGVPEAATPDDFPFNHVAGETVEAALIAVQLRTVIEFALSRKYVPQESLGDLFKPLVSVTNNRQEWVLALALMSGRLIAGESACRVLAHYFLNDPASDPRVVRVADRLVSGLPMLIGFSMLATAMAFGDESTAEAIMAKFRS